MKTVAITKVLDETDKKILQKTTSEIPFRKICYDLNLTPHQAAARIREMKKYYNCKNIGQLLMVVGGI